MRKLAESTKLFSKFLPNNSTPKLAYLDLCLVSSSSVTLTLPLGLQFQGMKGMFSLEIFFHFLQLSELCTAKTAKQLFPLSVCF